MWNISRLSRYFDAFIAATSACSWLKRPFRRCKVDYCYSTFDLHCHSLLHQNRANSHTLRTKNFNSSLQGRKIKTKLADITIHWMKWRDEATRWTTTVILYICSLFQTLIFGQRFDHKCIQAGSESSDSQRQLSHWSVMLESTERWRKFNFYHDILLLK